MTAANNFNFAPIDRIEKTYYARPGWDKKRVKATIRKIKDLLNRRVLDYAGAYSSQEVEMLNAFNRLRETIPALDEKPGDRNAESMIALFLYRLARDVTHREVSLTEEDRRDLVIIFSYAAMASDWFREWSGLKADNVYYICLQLGMLQRAAENVYTLNNPLEAVVKDLSQM